MGQTVIQILQHNFTDYSQFQKFSLWKAIFTFKYIMELVFVLKVVFLIQIQFRYILPYQQIQTKYTFNLRACKLSTPHIWKTTEENLGACFARCHHIDLCVSVSYNFATQECLGYRSCPEKCDGPRVEAWMNYCQGGWYFTNWYMKMELIFERSKCMSCLKT